MSYKFDEKARYAKSHEWVRMEGDVAVIGVSDYAQHLLSDIVYVELPEVGDTLTKGESMGTVESVKAAEDAYAPINGEVIEVNTELEDNPLLPACARLTVPCRYRPWVSFAPALNRNYTSAAWQRWSISNRNWQSRRLSRPGCMIPIPVLSPDSTFEGERYVV